MAIFQVRLNKRNQVTIPANVRKILGVAAHDVVRFETVDGKVTIEKVKLTLAEIRQSIPALKRDGKSVLELDFEELMDMDREARERIDCLPLED